jgi:hypothetical protein
MFPAGCSHSGRPPPMSLRRPGGFLVGGGWQLLADPARQATRSAGNRAWPSAWSGMDGVSRHWQPPRSSGWWGQSVRLARSAWRRSLRCWRSWWRRSARLVRWPANRVGTLGAAGDRPGAGGWVAGAAFAVQLDDSVGAQDGVLLVAADHSCSSAPVVPGPGGRRGCGPQPPGPGWGGRSAAAAGGGDRPLADRLVGCGRACQGRGGPRLCAATAKWCPTRPRRR